MGLTKSNGEPLTSEITLVESWPVGGSLTTLAPRIGSCGSSWGEATPLDAIKTMASFPAATAAAWPKMTLVYPAHRLLH
jgi:hypothetical protein